MCRIDPPDDAWVDPIIDEPEGTHYMTFSAPSLGPGGEASYLVYLPPDYDKSTTTRYPVLYYLHGGGSSRGPPTFGCKSSTRKSGRGRSHR